MSKESGREAWQARLHGRVEELGAGNGAERRRERLIEWATGQGLGGTVVERAYDVAVEEGIDPALGLALVESGIGVRELAPPTPISEEDTHTLVPPDWVGAGPAASPEITLERRLRNTFRRLRGSIESHGDFDTAMKAFTAEQDIGPVTYPEPL